jgi:putative ABC transport system permease protein
MPVLTIVRDAYRAMARRRGVSLGVILALALALSVTVGLWSVLDGLMFRPLPFPKPAELLAVGYKSIGGAPAPWSYRPELADHRIAARDAILQSSLVESGAQAGGAVFFGRDESADLGLEVAGVDAAFFQLFGLRPLLGVGFGADDERSSPAVVGDSGPLPIVIGYNLWGRLYGSDPSVLSGARVLAGREVRILGVMGPGVKFPDETNVWAPVSSRRDRIPAYVRLATRATQAELAGAFPELQFTALQDAVDPGRVGVIELLLGCGIVLLIVTWVQVAALTFSGESSQLHEIGVRIALGAMRRDLLVQLLLEDALLGAAALGLAWLAARPTAAFIAGLLPEDLRRGRYLDSDWRSFAFGCVLSVAGFAALATPRFFLMTRLISSSPFSDRTIEHNARSDRRRQGLIAGQLTLTCFLLYVAGLAAHSFVRATTFDYGFDVDHVLMFTPPPWARPGRSNQELLADYAQHNQRIAESLRPLRALPDVIAAEAFHAAPLGLGFRQPRIPISLVDGQARSDLQVRLNEVGPEFVRALGVSIIAGQGFQDPEYASADNVAIVNETFAHQLAPAIDVLGTRMSPSVIGRTIMMREFQAPRRIIGVVKDLVDATPDLPPDPQVFAVRRQPAGFLVIRLNTSTDTALPSIRGVMEGVWGPLRAAQFVTMDDELRRLLTRYRGQSILLSLIAVSCLPIAIIGLVGTLEHSVRVRTREIAIRIAIGADASAVQRWIIRRALILVGIGLTTGTMLGGLGGVLVAHELFHVYPVDMMTISGVGVLLLCVGWLSALIPARKATRVQPGVALRHV